MSDKQLQTRPYARWLGLAVLIGGLVAAAAVYVKVSRPGNGSAVTAVDCADALRAARRTDPLAKGEVAAFEPTGSADLLSDLSFKGPDGGDLSLADFAGKTVLLNFWATWCVPCRTEMPALDRLEAAMGGDRFQVVAINLDLNDATRARAFLDNIGVKQLAFYSDPTMGIFAGLKRRGLAFGLPTTLLVDGKGCRIGVMEGPAAWDSEDARALIRSAMAAG
jgi:thiol-disulfide isomerase/thioredoxin